MLSSRRRLIFRLTATAAASLVFTAAVAGEFSAQDTREISNYVLTDSGFAKYTQATHSLAALPKPPSKYCDDDDGQQSLSEAVARFDAVPGVQAAIRSAGMTTREYLVFSFSLLQNGVASWALAQQGAKPTPDMSMANVNFYRKHEAAIVKLGEEMKAADCDADDADDANDEADDSIQN